MMDNEGYVCSRCARVFQEGYEMADTSFNMQIMNVCQSCKDLLLIMKSLGYEESDFRKVVY